MLSSYIFDTDTDTDTDFRQWGKGWSRLDRNGTSMVAWNCLSMHRLLNTSQRFSAGVQITKLGIMS